MDAAWTDWRTTWQAMYCCAHQRWTRAGGGGITSVTLRAWTRGRRAGVTVMPGLVGGLDAKARSDEGGKAAEGEGEAHL
jgi:hypothetical protein